MRVAGILVVIAASLAATKAPAQGFDAGVPEGPRITQDEAEEEINRLRAIVRELEREISDLRREGARQEPSAQKADLKGIWVGSVSCGRRQFTITFTVSEQFGRVGKGKWAFTGFATGTDEAQISPMPTADSETSYMIVTAKANTYDYIVQLDSNTITGKATQQNCRIYLERS